MEDVSLTTDADGQSSDEVVRTLAAQRARVQDFVAAHQRRLRQAEAELAKQVALIGEELARDQRRTVHGQTELAQVRTEVAEGHAELVQGREQLEFALARLRQGERELGQLRREHEADADELARQRQRLQEKSAEVEHAGEALAAERQATKIQRRRIAQEFKAQRAAHFKELQRHRNEWKRADENLQQQHDELARRQTALGEAQALAADLDVWRRQCAVLEQQLAERTAAIDCAERRLQAAGLEGESLQGRLTEALGAVAAERKAFESRLTEACEAASRAAAGGSAAVELAAERDRLVQRLAEAEKSLAESERHRSQAEQRLAEAPSPQSVDGLADMKRRYDMALDDLRELRQRCAELEQKLAGIPKAPTAALAGNLMDWESQKKRMLAAWEANVQDDGDDQRREERLKLQDVIAETDAAMAHKDQELEELRRRLETMSGDNSATAAGVAAFDELLSHDENVRTERERLQHLQLEWEEKLRRAEIDLSVERAKMARERAGIEERHRQLQELQAQRADEPAAAPGKEKKPPRGRWLTRLGLKEDDTA